MMTALARRATIGGILSAIVSQIFPIPSASAQAVEEFYRGKTLQINVGFGVGASYDTYGGCWRSTSGVTSPVIREPWS